MALTQATYTMVKGAPQGVYDYVGSVVTGNTTVSSAIELQGQSDFVVTINNGVTLTIEGPFNAGLFQVFDCIGTGKVIFSNGQEIKPEWFGTDGVTDSAAIQKAVDSINTVRGGTIVFDSNRKYAIDTTVTIDPTTGPINLLSNMVSGEGQVGGYLFPTQNLANGMIRYSSPTRAPRQANITGLSFYDPTQSKLVGGALVLDDWTGRCSNCNMEYIVGPAIVTDNVIMSGFYNLRIRLCGQNASGKYAIMLGKTGSSYVTQSVVVDNLISEANFYGPYVNITDKAYDIKITNAQFEAETTTADSNKAFIYINGTRTIIANCGFNRNLYSSVIADTNVVMTNCIFDSNNDDGNPKMWLYGQGSALTNITMTGGLKNQGYDLILGNPASPAPVYTTVSNLSMSYGGGIWDGGESTLSNITMVNTYDVTPAPTGKYGISLGMTTSYPSKLTNYTSYNIKAGNSPLLIGDSGCLVTNATKSQSRGGATITNPATTAVVTHGLDFTPTVSQIIVTSPQNLGALWITSITSTQFTINVETSPASAATLGWRVQF